MNTHVHYYLFFLSTTALVLISSIFAADPNPLQDFCVAVNDTKDAVFVNGKVCKNPKLATADDFHLTGIEKERNTSNRLGTLVSMFNVDVVPGLNTLGVSLARVDFGPYGVNPPHVHPRGSEMFVVLEGTLYAGFVTSNPDHRLFSKILHKGDAFVFPMGLIHFQRNLGKTKAVALATFGSQNAGLITVPNAIFGAKGPVDSKLLSIAFQIDEKEVRELQGDVWFNNG